MKLIIKDAVKLNLKARIALLSPTGGGKTYSMLTFLFSLVKLGMAKKVGVIDTEHGSASKYIGPFPIFRVVEMADDFSPEQYIEALQLLADDGCDAVGVDSLSHAWAGKGGSLELKDRFGKQKGFNDYTAWGPVTAMQNRLIEAMLSYPGHLVTTMRLKMEHVIEKDPVTGKNVVRKVGLQPVQRDGLEYEFDVVGDFDQDHNFSVSKTRCSALDGYAVNKPGEEVIRKLKGWLESGEAAAARAKPTSKEEHPAPVVAEKPVALVPAAVTVAATPSTTAPIAVVRPAESFTAQILAADSISKLEGIAAVIGPAHKAKAISDEERKKLIFVYLEQQKRLMPAQGAVA
jgi:AAA domain